MEKEIHRFEYIPSSEEFSSLIESKNIPAVFGGCVKDLKAFSLWDPFSGGLDYLQEKVGSSIVEAMLSESAPIFYGSLGNHERAPIPFSTFITYCKELLYIKNASAPCHDYASREGHNGVLDSENGCNFPDVRQLYLAQIPILNIENQIKSPLEALQEDVQQPSFIEKKDVSSINFWMNGARTRSSTHYDPHHNLLCVIAGSKQVVLWPPSAVPMLYPMAIYGEASNHSAVNLEMPNLSLHCRVKQLPECSQIVNLYAGDALFIPEGWFHQVNSEDLTIAINFWWQSDVLLSMPEHMDAYYLRRMIRRLVDKETKHMLENVADNVSRVGDHEEQTAIAGVDQSPDHFDEDLNVLKVNERLNPFALRALYQLVSFVNESFSDADQSKMGPARLELSTSGPEGEMLESGVVHPLKLDLVASIFLNLAPSVLEDVLLTMVYKFPRTLEALILYQLSPMAAEVLTQKFDEMDQRRTKQKANDFYAKFYSVFDNQFAAMEAILGKKESFGLQVFKDVLDKYLGVRFACHD